MAVGLALDHGRGWDLAIPQHDADELYRMGFDHAGPFLADCTGPAAIAKVHHAGEAYIVMADMQAADNATVVNEAFVAVHDDGPPGALDVGWWEFITDNPEIQMHADAGFTRFADMKVAYEHGWIDGKRSVKERMTLLQEAFNARGSTAEIGNIINGIIAEL